MAGWFRHIVGDNKKEGAFDGGDDMYVGPNMQTTGGPDDAEAGNAADADEVDDNDLG